MGGKGDWQGSKLWMSGLTISGAPPLLPLVGVPQLLFASTTVRLVTAPSGQPAVFHLQHVRSCFPFGLYGLCRSGRCAGVYFAVAGCGGA